MIPPKHTPGPWRIIDSIDAHKITIVGADFPTMGFVADVNLCRNNTYRHADGHANAALIAAAPAMYEALKASLLAIPDGMTSNTSPICQQIRAALAQADGKQ